MKILTSRQISDVDRLTTEIYRIPSILLMENAGKAVFDALREKFPSLSGTESIVFCGKGNNGGDGFVVARYLSMAGGKPLILLLADPSKLIGDALANWEMIRALQVPFQTVSSTGQWRAAARNLRTPDIIVDAIFGTGLTRPAGSYFKGPIDWINRTSGSCFVVSVDIPSGLFADSPDIPGPAVRAHRTVTFTAPKLAHIIPPAADLAGKVTVAPIGSPPALLDNAEYRMETVDFCHIRRVLGPRPRRGHKGDFGQVFVLAGSPGKSGAALMTGLAALRSGAGLVTLLIPASLQKETVGKFPELMTESVAETSRGAADISGLESILEFSSKGNVLIVGPGMTTESSTQELIRKVVQRSTVPVVLDADGLNAFARKADRLDNKSGQPIVITPHPGEMARLLGTTISRVQDDRIGAARRASERCGVITVLKGFQTVVSTPSGRVLVNSTGNPGMATGGSGDILAGMAGRFVGLWNRRYRGADTLALADHVAVAVYLHGLAGDLAAENTGMESMIATDLLKWFPEAFRRATRE